MDMLLIILAILAIFVATMYRQEHMTNKDLVSALQAHGTTDPKQSKDDTPTQAPIYGPKASEVPPTATKTDGKGKNGGNGVYPEIYGPEYQGVPGMKQTKAKHSSDDTSDDTYDYNPDLQKAFPTSGPPQPFLTDFSRFQK
jgi:hypothetical protein